MSAVESSFIFQQRWLTYISNGYGGGDTIFDRLNMYTAYSPFFLPDWNDECI